MNSQRYTNSEFHMRTFFKKVRLHSHFNNGVRLVMAMTKKKPHSLFLISSSFIYNREFLHNTFKIRGSFLAIKYEFTILGTPNEFFFK